MDTTTLGERWLEAIAAAADAGALGEVEKRLLGPKGEVVELVRSVSSMPRAERPTFGKAANALKQEVEKAIAAARVGKITHILPFPLRVPTVLLLLHAMRFQCDNSD